MIGIGSILLVISALNGVSMLAFIGLGITFWGVLLFYVRPKESVSQEILNSTSFGAIINIESALKEIKNRFTGVYLPPDRLKDFNSSVVFIRTNLSQKLPTAAETGWNTSKSRNSPTLFIAPPGLGLSKLFEKTLGKSFTETNIEDMKTLIPSVFDELQIAGDIFIKIESNSIIITVKRHIFQDLCREMDNLERTHKALGCPLTSALACVVAKSSRKPVIIEKEDRKLNDITIIEFRLLEE